jgi:LCP family protein required for cell wall assembly
LGRLRGWSRRKLLATAAGGVVVLLFVTTAFGAAAFTFITGHIKQINPFCHSCSRPSGGAVGDLNILIVGSDSRAGLTAQQQRQLHVGHDPGQRSDTMILLHLPAGGGKAVLVSLPRDSYVTIPAHTDSTGHTVAAQKNKLNAAYSEGGAPLTIRTVEQNTGVRIDHYIEINFLGFVKMVNALGGVDVCTATPIHDPVHYDAQTGGYVGSGLELHAGTNQLSGDTALAYVRAREFDPRADLGRIDRQQKFMAAMIRKAESAGVLLNPIKLVHFLDTLASSLTTDKGFGVSQMRRLAEKLHSMSPSNVQLLTVPLSNTSYSTPVGSTVLWNPALSHRLFTDFTQDRPITNLTPPKHHKVTIAPSSVAVRVLNATSTAGLAARAAQSLQTVGFRVSGTGNAPAGSDPAATVVRYGPSRSNSAQTVAAAVPGSTMAEDASLGNGLELLVGSGYSGVQHVQVATPSSSAPTVTTAAGSPCS